MKEYLPYIAGFGLVGLGMVGLRFFGEQPLWYSMIGAGIGMLTGTLSGRKTQQVK